MSNRNKGEDVRTGRDQLNSNRTVDGKPMATKVEVKAHAAKMAKRFLRGNTVGQMVMFSDPGTLGGHFASLKGDGLAFTDVPAIRECPYNDVQALPTVLDNVTLSGALERFANTCDLNNEDQTVLLARTCIVAASL